MTDPELPPVTSLDGVGPARAAALARMGVEDVRDLLLLLPKRIESAGEELPLADAAEAVGEPVIVSGTIAGRTFQRFGRRATLRLVLMDDGGRLEVLFFNQPWLRERFARGETARFAGRVVRTARGPALVSPRIEGDARAFPAPGSWVAVHPLGEGIGPNLLRGLLDQALEKHADALADALPDDARARLALPHLRDAVRTVHDPRDPETFAAARRRVLLEGLLPVQARVLARRGARAEGEAREVRVDDALHRELVGYLPFTPTDGQLAVMGDLRRDLARRAPMRRLLQGDVGVGKTAVALYACMAVARAGGTSAFMAPTELLAEQHRAGAQPLLEHAGLRAAVLTGSLRAAERKALLARVAAGEVDVLFGTHALLSSDVRLPRLALAVVDEQHRFGVAQRARLLEKGRDVHLLLMTATPIPRTLALTVYADLDASILRERPPGRGEVRTRWLRQADRRRLPEFLRERLAAGERLFWVCPRIGEGEEDEKGGAEKVRARLLKTPLAEFGVELVHGRLKPAERERRLDRFRRGAVGTLVATTVIEVGVDVPAATVMVVDGAERLGLAQLHQLRGRVGRGPRDSWCILKGAKSARERLELLERTNDGFEVAEEDLRLRGMGELAGLRQSGDSGLAVDPEADAKLLLAARDLLLENPALVAEYARRSPVAAAVQTP